MNEQIEKSREFWAKVAKENGWYQEPFYVQVWVNRTTGLVTDSVASRSMTQDVIVEWEEDDDDDV